MPTVAKKALTDEISHNNKTTPDFQSMIRIVFWNSMGFLFYLFILPYITSEYFTVNGKIIGLIIAALPFGRIFVTPIVGYLTDKISKKLLVFIGSLGRSLAYIIYYLSIGFESVIGFAVGVFVQGVLVGFFWPPLNTLIAEKSSKFYRSEAYGKRSGMSGWGSFVGAVISFLIFNFSDFIFKENAWLKYSPFIIFATVNIYAGIRFLKTVDENLKFNEKNEVEITDSQIISSNIPKNKENTKNILTTSRKKQFFILGIMCLSLASMFSSMNDHIGRPFIQLYMNENIFSTDLQVMLVVYSASTIGLILAPILGNKADRIPIILGITIIAFIGATLTFILIQITNPILFAIVLIIDFAMSIAGVLFTQNLFSRISIENRGKIFGLIEWMALFGWIIGPLLGGYGWDEYGHKSPFIISIILEICLIPLFFMGYYWLKSHLAEKIQENNPIKENE